MSNELGIFDRAIATVSPAWAAKRAMARAALDQVNGAMATYGGGVSNRLSTVWNRHRSLVGGAMRDRLSMGSMRDRARKIYRDNPVGKSLLDTEADNIMGDGFTLQMQSGSPEFDQEVEDRWYAWMERADIRGVMSGSQLQRTSWKEPRKDGDGGFVLVSSSDTGSRLQYIPGDRIATAQGIPNGPTMFDGIEVDRTGAPIAFHVLDENEFGKSKTARIDAADFVYLPHTVEPLDIRGASVYSTIFTLLDQLDGYIDAVVVAARMAAVFGLLFKTNKPASQYGGLGMARDSQGEERRVITLENGMTRWVGTDEEVAQVTPQQPMNQTPDFIRAMFRLICLPFDMPLEIGQKDLSQVNFSGGRIGLLGYYRSCRVKQDWIKTRCWDRIFRWWIDREVKLQKFTSRVPAGRSANGRAIFENHEFLGREWDYTDPVSEAQADLIEVSMGTKSVQQACAARGRDYQGTFSQRKIHRDATIASGLSHVLSSMTRDEQQKVTAVDAQGNPLSGAAQPLNGIQITAVMDVIAKLAEKTIPAVAAIEALERLGIAADRAKEITAAVESNRSGVSASDRDFQRQVLLQLLNVQGARQAVYNSTDIEDLIGQTGLPPEKKKDGQTLEVPFLPVVAESGPLVSGDVIYDPQGDIVGGDVENNLPAEAPPQVGGTGSPAASGNAVEQPGGAVDATKTEGEQQQDGQGDGDGGQSNGNATP